MLQLRERSRADDGLRTGAKLADDILPCGKASDRPDVSRDGSAVTQSDFHYFRFAGRGGRVVDAFHQRADGRIPDGCARNLVERERTAAPRAGVKRDADRH